MQLGWAIMADDRVIDTFFTDETYTPDDALAEFEARNGTYLWDLVQCRDGWPVANLIGDQT